MSKKEWLKPELSNLAVSNTATEEVALDCETANGGEKCIFPHDHVCPKCKKDFGHKIGSHLAWALHVPCCQGSGEVVPPLS